LATGRSFPRAASLLPVAGRARKPIRAIREWGHQLVALRYRGDELECPCCSGSLRAFRRRPGDRNRWCPRCRSLERHRSLWLLLDGAPELLRPGTRVLHFAPEPSLERLLRTRRDVDYTTADLDPGAGDVAADLTALPFADGSFDLVLCSHVLEHVADDALAISELTRVVAGDGHLLLMHPIDRSRSETYEDPEIVDPAARAAAYGQHDHVRVYGTDFGERLRAGGLDFTVRSLADELPPEQVDRFGLREPPGSMRGDDIYVCKLVRRASLTT
jgi:hypothetical protein